MGFHGRDRGKKMFHIEPPIYAMIAPFQKVQSKQKRKNEMERENDTKNRRKWQYVTDVFRDSKLAG